MQDELELVDPDPISHSFACIRAAQPIGDIFIASIPYKTLIRISYFDVRRVLQEDRDVERYLGIQRPLEDRRVKSLSEYVNYKDAETFDVPVTIFVGADISDQAHIFATVNLEQTKVQKSLVYDLFSLARTRSPQRTCHNIAVALDRDPKGALYQRIKRLGFATIGRTFEPITQSTFVESLLPYISTKPKLDRDLLLRGKQLDKVFGEELFKIPLRNSFIEKKDLQITEIVSNYFEAVRKKWPDAWQERGRGIMLNRTNGFRALMRFFRNAYFDVAAPGDVPSSRKFYERVFKPMRLNDRHFTTENFVPGTGGEARLYRVLRGQETL